MVNRILSLVGCLGTALVVAALAHSLRLPGEGAVGLLPRVGRPGLRAAAIRSSQWREIGEGLSRRQARYGTLAATSVLVVLGILVAINYIGARAEQALGPDRGQAVQPVGPDAATCSRSSTRRCRSWCSRRSRSFRATATS